MKNVSCRKASVRSRSGAFLLSVALTVLGSGAALATPVPVANPGFEAGFEGWAVQGGDAAVSLTGKSASGQQAAKFDAKDALLQQVLSLPGAATYTATVDARGAAMIGVKVGDNIVFERAPKKRGYKPLSVTFQSDGTERVILFLGYGGETVRYDNVRVNAVAGGKVSPTVARNAGSGPRLVANVPPSENFDLQGWNLSIPTDEDGNGKSDTIKENRLASGYEDERFFFTAPDGGMTFRVPVQGFKTSKRTKFTRTELREMLRRGDTSISTKRDDGYPNKNNWVFSSAPQASQDMAGAVDGVLEAELAVDRVTTTGKASEQGRVIIGQIHAKDDEPIRLYYRKLPGNTRGSIYFAHESLAQEKDIYVHMIGDRKNSAEDPVGGFALGERFGYRIEVVGNTLKVDITQNGAVVAQEVFDMSESGYDVADDYHYFKAGAYSQNHTGDPDDYDQVTFYKLKVTH